MKGGKDTEVKTSLTYRKEECVRKWLYTEDTWKRLEQIRYTFRVQWKREMDKNETGKNFFRFNSRYW